MVGTDKTVKPRRAGKKVATAKAAAAKRTATAGDEQRSGPKEQPRPLEWIVGAISAALIIAVLGYLGYQGISRDSRPPEFIAQVQAVEPVGALFHVTVSVTNAGDETAAGVIVEAELSVGGEAEERGEITFDYLAAGSTRQGSFVFRNDPSRGELGLSVLGYTEP